MLSTVWTDGETWYVIPEGVDLAHYPHFNTNTLWFRTQALAKPMDLQWFAVRKTIDLGGADPSPVIQFERLIGQASELISSSFVVVARPIPPEAPVITATLLLIFIF